MSRHDSYSAAIEDVITLVRSGRVGMALTVLDGICEGGVDLDDSISLAGACSTRPAMPPCSPR